MFLDIAALISKLKRLSEPVAPTYAEECAAKCEGCREGWSSFRLPGRDIKPSVMHLCPPNGLRSIGCTAPTIEEYAERLERENAVLQSQLDTATSLYIKNHAELEAEVSRLRGVTSQIQEIMKEYRHQYAKGYVDSPGGLEHMGDVWSLLWKWDEALAERALSVEGEKGTG